MFRSSFLSRRRRVWYNPGTWFTKTPTILDMLNDDSTYGGDFDIPFERLEEKKPKESKSSKSSKAKTRRLQRRHSDSSIPSATVSFVDSMLKTPQGREFWIQPKVRKTWFSRHISGPFFDWRERRSMRKSAELAYKAAIESNEAFQKRLHQKLKKDVEPTFEEKLSARDKHIKDCKTSFDKNNALHEECLARGDYQGMLSSSEDMMDLAKTVKETYEDKIKLLNKKKEEEQQKKGVFATWGRGKRMACLDAQIAAAEEELGDWLGEERRPGQYPVHGEQRGQYKAAKRNLQLARTFCGKSTDRRADKAALRKGCRRSRRGSVPATMPSHAVESKSKSSQRYHGQDEADAFWAAQAGSESKKAWTENAWLKHRKKQDKQHMSVEKATAMFDQEEEERQKKIKDKSAERKKVTDQYAGLRVEAEAQAAERKAYSEEKYRRWFSEREPSLSDHRPSITPQGNATLPAPVKKTKASKKSEQRRRGSTTSVVEQLGPSPKVEQKGKGAPPQTSEIFTGGMGGYDRQQHKSPKAPSPKKQIPPEGDMEASLRANVERFMQLRNQ